MLRHCLRYALEIMPKSHAVVFISRPHMRKYSRSPEQIETDDSHK